MNLHDLAIILKLISGDTIICQVLSDADQKVLIRDPLQINITRDSTPQGMLVSTYCSDWFHAAASRVHMIRKEHILSASIPNNTLKEEYARIVSEKNETDPDTKTKLKMNQKKDYPEKNNWGDLNFKFNGKN
jgi:hypothetical protein